MSAWTQARAAYAASHPDFDATTRLPVDAPAPPPPREMLEKMQRHRRRN